MSDAGSPRARWTKAVKAGVQSIGREEPDVTQPRFRVLASPGTAGDGAVLAPSRPPGESASVDSLTRLPGRDEFLAQLGDALSRFDPESGSIAVLFIDVDGFRRINRDRGHGVGDELLFSAARRIVAAVGPGDLVARSGGDEFVVMSVGLERNLDVVGLAGRLHESFDDPFALGEDEFAATISIGVAIASDGAPAAESLVGDAEAALERNPSGVRRLELFDPELRARLRDRSELANDLEIALRENRLTLAYQPIVDVATGRIAAVEALARWKHPERGPVSPELFVAVAEESGLSDELLQRVLDQAAEGFTRIAVADPSRQIALAFNVTANQLASDLLVPGARALIARTGASPDRFVVEISEKALGGEADRFLPRILELRDLGLRISLDDFGTASTSISQLRGLPVDEIKLDRSFVSGLGAGSADAALAAGLLPIARALGIEVVAEGIETDQQLAHLFALGYRWGQGYRFSAPQSPDDIAALLARGPLPAAGLAGASSVDAEHQRFREALLAGDAKGAESVIAEAVRSGHGAMTIQTEIIGRALRWVDSEWEAGRLDAADEHLAAAICERQLTTVLDTLRPQQSRYSRRVLLAAIRGEGHAAELRSAADALASEGYETVFLGTNIETDTLETATGTHRPGAVCLTLSSPDADAELDAVIDRLKAVEEPPLLLVGGDALAADGGDHDGAITVTSPADALDVLARELAPESAPARGADAVA